MIRNRKFRRSLAGALVLGGALLMWLSPAVSIGLGAFAVGLVLELGGLAIERRSPPER